jgi:pimeloyl-ACP methyl ester carboxylesterase
MLRRLLPAVAGATLTIGLAAGLLTAPAQAVPEAAASTGTLEWGPCERASLAAQGFECATLEVPWDWAEPDTEGFALAVTRHRSTGSADERIGSLFFNPGGPGGSGLDAALGVWASLPRSITDRFDLVTWDPRGIGSTVPALQDCAAPYPTRPNRGEIDWARVVERMGARLERVNAECFAANRSFINHMGTQQVVADLDALRAAVGDDKLTYWGMSYGTRIGYVYALTYPDRVRAVLLDGPIDPASTMLSLSEGGVGPDQAYGSFADLFPLADEQAQVVERRLARKLLPLPNGTRLTRWDFRDTVYGYIASQGAYTFLTEYIGLVHLALTGTPEEKVRARIALTEFALRPANGNVGGAFAAVNCLDYADRPTTRAQTNAVLSAVRHAPVYGGSLATMYASNCVGLPVTADPIPVITGRGPSVPLLISGATRDGSTISTWLARMSRAFPASRTVTYSGGQHVVWRFAESECVNSVIDRYMLTTELPRVDVGCSNSG